MNSIVKKVEELAPFYTPEWKFSAKDQEPGTALVMSFAQMMEGIVKRFNRVPDKNFIAFLNMLGIEQLPAQPARAPVTFRLVNGAVSPVMVKALTQISAESDYDNEPVVFETENNIMITPANLAAAFNVSVKEDRIVSYPDTFFLNPKEREKHDIMVFDTRSGENLQKHEVYFTQDDYLTIKSAAAITLSFKNSSRKYRETGLAVRFTNPVYTKWEYWGEADGILGWHTFDKWYEAQNEVVLVKAKEGWLKENDINGINSKWIRCTGASAGMESLKEIEFSSCSVRTDYFEKEGSKTGISPELLFCNDRAAEQTDFYPFGESFVVGDTFYIASREVLSKKGATITLDIDLQIHELQMVTLEHEIKWKLVMKKSDVDQKEAPRIHIVKTLWEYWNGNVWVKLHAGKDAETIFVSHDEIKTVSFKCPEDLQESFVNSYTNLWIRVQISKIENMYTLEQIFCSPFIKGISFRYRDDSEGRPVQHCITYNNLDFKNRIVNFAGEGSEFKPFYSPDQSTPAFYMGFDSPPKSGPIGMLFSLVEKKQYEEDMILDWEYLRQSRRTTKWESLKVADRTNSLTQSDTVMFVGPDDFVRKTLFGRELYWIRLVNTDRKLEDEGKVYLAPRLNGIFMNTVWSTQQETIAKGILEPVKGPENRGFVIYKTPVFDEEMWIDELESLAEEDQRSLLSEQGVKIDLVRDERGDITEFWVNWKNVTDFYESGEDDRHYILEPTAGLIRFGDGKNGKTPVTYEGNNIRISYKTGGGTRGNVKEFKICRLLSSLSYVDEVYNPEPATGGSNIETVENAIRRGPEKLKHRNRAITVEDIESLAKQVSQSITKVKCLPNFNIEGKNETGWFTVVIAPLVEGIYQRPSTELKLRVLKYIRERTSGIVAFSKHVQVVEPIYVEVSLYVTLFVENMDFASVAEAETLEKINAFLNPVSGNYGGKGWEIGQVPHLSMFYSLLKSVKGVNYVEKVSMTANILSEGKLTEIDPNKIGQLPHMLVVNGKHKVLAGI